MPDSTLHLSNDCPNCQGVGYLGLSYPDDPTLRSGSYTPPICTWCNGSPKQSSKWSSSITSTSPSSLSSQCYSHLNNNSVSEGWNLVLPLARPPPLHPNPNHSHSHSHSHSPHHPHHSHHQTSSTTSILPFSLENRSFPSSPGSTTDLSPSGYSESKGYFDFIPIQQSHYDHSAPISPGSLSVPGSDNNDNLLPPPMSPSSGCSRTQNQRDSKARCLKKLDNAMEKLIGLLPSEMQLSCKRGRANGLKLVEDYILRIIAENKQVRSESKKTTLENDRLIAENKKLHEELSRLKLQNSSQFR